jgi:hypothetical protein
MQDIHIKCTPFYCNVTNEPNGRGMKTRFIMSHDQIYNSCHLSFQIFPPEALHLQLLKWRLSTKKKQMRAVASRVWVCGDNVKGICYCVWKGTANKRIGLQVV